jgi:hypothetical protein
MIHKNQLYPWCIIRPFPNMRSQIVGRFRRRVDAEGHLRVLKRLIPDVSYFIMFDITPEDSDSEDLTPPTSGLRPATLSLKLRLPYKGRGEPDSPLLAGEGLGERSTEE